MFPYMLSVTVNFADTMTDGSGGSGREGRPPSGARTARRTESTRADRSFYLDPARGRGAAPANRGYSPGRCGLVCALARRDTDDRNRGTSASSRRSMIRWPSGWNTSPANSIKEVDYRKQSKGRTVISLFASVLPRGRDFLVRRNVRRKPC